MEFLKEILGDELFEQFAEKMNAYNGNEANKDKQVKLGNLGTGEYVGKGKYDALQETLTGRESEIANANALIEQLKKASKGNEEMQSKFATYEQENAKLQAELQETKIKSAIKVALLSEKASDIDYLTYKLNEKLKVNGQDLELDEQGNIKGWEDVAQELKNKYPLQFASEGNTEKKIIANKLPEIDPGKGMSKIELLKKPYTERVKIATETPEVYSAAFNQ